MKIAPLPANELDRLAELKKYGILDTDPEPSFDSIVQLAAYICQAPIAAISLIDEQRQWFKACVGLDAKETSRDIAFCTHAILQDDPLVVTDTLLDERFFDNPLVTNAPDIRSYAGVPLVASSGYRLGTLCVIDYVPRQLAPEQLNAIKALADNVMAHLELRLSHKNIRKHVDDLQLATSVFTHSHEGIMITNAAGTIIQVNDSFTRITGYEHDEAVGQSPRMLQSGRYDSEFYAAMWRSLAENDYWSGEAFNRHKSGEGYAGQLTISVVRNDQGKVQSYVAQLADITERKQTEEKLRLSNMVIQNSSEGIMVTDVSNQIIAINPAFTAITGYTLENVLGKNPKILSSGIHDRDFYQEMWSSIKSTGYWQGEILDKHKTGEIHPRLMSITAIKDDAETVTHFVCTQSDYTERKAVENLLHESQERFSRIVRHLPGMVFQLLESKIADQFSFVYLNESTSQLFGVTSDALLTNAAIIYKHIHSADVSSFDASRIQSAKDIQVWDWEGRILSVNHGEKWVNLRAMPRRQEDGMIVWDGVMLNISRSKYAEIALAESRQLLRELAAGSEITREQERKRISREVHDELGQTLTALRLDVSMVRLRFGLNNPDLMNKVLGMTELVDRALQSVRDVAANLRPAVLDMGIESALDWLSVEFSEHSGTPCTLHTSEEPFNIDEARSVGIFRIVQESLTNVARYAEASHVEIFIGLRGADLLVEISDDGKGFDPELRSTRQSFGLLGMRERAIALGGDIYIISALGNGTIVSVLIPMEQGLTEK